MTRETLQPYISMADMLARTFGKECEVVLYDMTNPQHSVVYAANNTVTNCQIGGPPSLFCQPDAPFT